jgi:hypothetical protein
VLTHVLLFGNFEWWNLEAMHQSRPPARPCTNAFSKKWENHWAALCLWFAFYYFCRVHSKLRYHLLLGRCSLAHVVMFSSYRQWKTARAIVSSVLASGRT